MRWEGGVAIVSRLRDELSRCRGGVLPRLGFTGELLGVVLVLLTVMVANGWLPAGASFLGFVIVWVTFLFLPGYVLLSLLIRQGHLDLWDMVPLAFASSLGILIIPWLLSIIFPVSLTTIGYIILALTAILLLLHWWQRAHLSVILDAGASSKIPASKTLSVLIAALVVLVFLWALLVDVYRNTYADLYTHIAQAQRMLVLPETWVSLHSLGWDYAVALLTLFSRSDPVLVWENIFGCLIPTVFLATFAFGRNLFKNASIGLLGALLALIQIRGSVHAGVALAAVRVEQLYPRNVALLVAAMALFSTFKYQRTKNPAFLLLSVFLVAITAVVHGLVGGLLAITLVAYATFYVAVRGINGEGMRRVLYVIAVTILVGLPFAIPLFGAYAGNEYPLVAALFDSFRGGIEGIRYVPARWEFYDGVFQRLDWTRGLFIFHPKVFFQDFMGVLGAFAFLLTPWLLMYIKREDSAIYLFACMVSTPLIIFNPLLVPALSALPQGPYIIERLVSVLPPIEWILGFFLYQGLVALWNALKTDFQLRQLSDVIIVILVLAASSTMIFSTRILQNNYYVPMRLPWQARGEPFTWQKTLQFIQTNIPEGSVLFADRETYLVTILPVFTGTGYKVVYPDTGNSLGIVLDPSADLEKILAILDETNTQYLVLRQPVPQLLARLRGEPAHFEQIYYQEKTAQDTEFVIFRYRRAADNNLALEGTSREWESIEW